MYYIYIYIYILFIYLFHVANKLRCTPHSDGFQLLGREQRILAGLEPG